MMFNNKKGISPLIATVLIIGFTVALAALIITWGGQFVRQTQSDVGEQTDVGIACTRMNFRITDVTCGGTLDLESVSVVSNGQQEIAGFIIRATNTTDTEVDESNARVFLEGFAGATLNWGASNPVVIAPISVEVIGQVRPPGQDPVPCEAGIQKVTLSSSVHPTCFA